MMVYPVLWMISGSFKGNAEILRGTLSLLPKELKLTNYATGWKGFGGTTFATFFTNSIFITVIATFGTVISSSLVAYALSRVRFRGRKFWFTCMLVTMMLPTQVIMIPQYLIYYRLGLVPGYVPLILPYFCGQAFFIYQMMQFMQGIPKDLDEAATIDGCSKYQIYSRIILPLMKPCGSVLRIAAFCVTDMAPDTIKTSLSKVVPHYMVPSQIIVQDALPLNPNGKIDRKLLDAYARTN